MIRELETVVLLHDVSQHGLKSGDVGAVVHRYGDGKAFEVEFVTAEGRTVAVLTLTESDVCPARFCMCANWRQHSARGRKTSGLSPGLPAGRASCGPVWLKRRRP